MNKNEESTRYFSDMQETYVAKLLEGWKNSNSGAGLFKKGDVTVPKASMLVECKTCMEDKNSFSIKKDWIIKNKKEAGEMRLNNHCIAFNFGPKQECYFVIDEKLMKYLTEKLIEDNC